MPMQVNITTQVNSASIRRETHNGREHLVLPSYTLPAGVIMNGGLYTAEQIDKHYPGLEGTLAPLGHPMVDGKFVSAFSPEGINAAHVGAWNRNVKKSGNRVYMEKWVDVEFAKSTEGGRELLQRVEALEKGEDVPDPYQRCRIPQSHRAERKPACPGRGVGRRHPEHGPRRDPAARSRGGHS